MSNTIKEIFSDGIILLHEGDTSAEEYQDIDYECIMTVQEFMEDCEDSFFIDYDGFGDMLTFENGKKVVHGRTWPSIRHKIPKHITHIEWYNR